MKGTGISPISKPSGVLVFISLSIQFALTIIAACPRIKSI